MEAVEFDLSETLDNVANVITVKAQEKENLEVLFYLDSRVPNFLVGDPLRLNQILVNLGNNAVKFTEQGEIVLTTQIIESSDGKVTLQFSMRDTGIGMTEEQQSQAFPGFLSGRHLDHAKVRRHRVRADHQQTPGQYDGRRDPGGKRVWAGLHIQFYGRLWPGKGNRKKTLCAVA